MPVFKLKKDTMLRLEKEFERFQKARKIIHENIINYLTDYRQFNGKPQDRKEFLEREYLPRSPDLNSLLFSDEKNFLWHIEDIVILTGLSQPSISRILSKMKKSSEWFSKLLPLQVESKSSNNNLIYAYREEIFDMIIDYQEAKYLERFITPRRGEALQKTEAKEILRYWDYLKKFYLWQSANDRAVNNEELNEVPDIPPMKLKDILILMFRKMFTAKDFTISTIIFAICFELARRFYFFIPVFAVVSSLIFAASVLLLKFRRGPASLISETGTIAMLSMILWGLALFSDGVIYSPSGAMLTLNDDHSITLVPELERGGRVTFIINSDSYDDLKEIYYRTSDAEEELVDQKFKSTSFNDFHYPILFIEPETQQGILNIELKYKDTKNKEHGPFKFSFDMEKTRFEASKEFILNRTQWLIVKNSQIIFSINGFNYADDVLEAVVYGFNTENPDKKIKIDPQNSRILIDIPPSIKFEYVSAYLVFKDGTKSETKKRQLEIRN
ncbi:MAG: hypothetical protein IJ597_08265 [Synergistaceae bacterium]|nr:hypothetical protein [Synergistaceae bacterium]